MDSLSFRIPEQQAPGEGAFDFRPAAVARWVEELPMGNIGEAAKRIYQAVREVNALKVPLQERLGMLEAVATPLDAILGQLEEHYSGSHFPMPQKTLRVVEFSNQLLAEMVIGYQSVLNSQEQSSWLFRMTHSDQWPVCVHRLLHYLGRIIANYRLLHRPTPSGVWLAVHRLFFEADRHGRLGAEIELSWADGVTETIADTYKRLLLLSLIEPQLFTRGQLDEVRQHMPVWESNVELLPPEKWHEEMESYCIRLDRDTPHTVQAEKCLEENGHKVPGVLLDISDIGVLLDDALLADPDSTTLSLSGIGISLQRETVETLRQCWHVPRGERAERYKTNRPVKVAVGMGAIFSLMRAERKRRHDGITDQQMMDNLVPLLPKGARRNVQKPQPSTANVWDTIFYGTEVTQNSWAMSGDESNYHYIEARELDYNERGVCLEFESSNLQSLDVGELIGFREKEGQELQLYMVRWLQEKGQLIAAGMMRLASEIEPLLVVMENEQEDMALGCLLGIGEDARPQLFLPHLQAVHERPLNMVVEKRLIPVTLRDKVSLSPLFDGYHFSLAEGLGIENLDEEMDLGEANQLLHRIAHIDEEPAEPKDKEDFSDLWDSL